MKDQFMPKVMLENATDEIMNAIKEAIAHDTPMENLRILIQQKLEDAREAGYSDGVDNEHDAYYV
jgi:hypothetical protein